MQLLLADIQQTHKPLKHNLQKRDLNVCTTIADNELYKFS